MFTRRRDRRFAWFPWEEQVETALGQRISADLAQSFRKAYGTPGCSELHPRLIGKNFPPSDMIDLGNSAFLSQSFSLFLSTLIANHAAFSGKKTFYVLLSICGQNVLNPLQTLYRDRVLLRKHLFFLVPSVGKCIQGSLRCYDADASLYLKEIPALQKWGKKLQKKASSSFPVEFYFKNFLKRTSLLSLIRELSLSHNAVMNRMRRDTLEIFC